ncbi:hypothetical protein [Lysinibacillus boronitolerans]|nr:hypothetical protein [Lysinibacillus boronitolerans]
MAFYAHVALHRFNTPPSQFLSMSRREQAFMIASMDIELEKEAEAAAKNK